jgi:hypothetical protein
MADKKNQTGNVEREEPVDEKGALEPGLNSSSADESVERGRKAIEMDKKFSPEKGEKKEEDEAKDAEQWRNEG